MLCGKTVIRVAQRNCIEFGSCVFLDALGILKSSSFESSFHLREQKKVCCCDQVNKVGGWSLCCDAVCTSYNSVFLFLICETVWNRLGVELPLSRIFMKHLLDCLVVNVQLMFHFYGHLMICGHRVTNFCNCVDHQCGLLLIF